MFIPFVGAFIALKEMPKNVRIEAWTAIAGPIVGTGGAMLCWSAALYTGSSFWMAAAYTGFFLNLFNLIPVSPLDGGRIAGAFTRSFWIGGYALGVAALVITRSPMLLLVLLVGLFTLWQRWRHPVPGYDAIPRGKRLAVALGFASLVAALAMTLPIGLEMHPRSG